MNQFYNPYQFIPVTGEINGNKERTAYADVAAGRHAHARHDLWQKNGASGRILCSLRLHTPTIVGARQTGQPPKRVAGYSWRGKHAIPGNSLKGMIGSIAEALSQSTLRVLDKHEEVPKTRPPKRWTVGLPVQGQNRPVPHPVKVDTHRYFARIDQDMVPWRRSSGQTQRDRLTPAELLFGLVEDIESGVSNDPGRNLAGRVRFHDALPLTGDGETDPEITLKILASPYLTGDKKAAMLPRPLSSTGVGKPAGVPRTVRNRRFPPLRCPRPMPPKPPHCRRPSTPPSPPATKTGASSTGKPWPFSAPSAI
jgi:hypothetical protein